ncbi:suppressor of fused domain protein [Neobacillus sp. YIM B06451]|uniref:suppressor of fused domain protein n=1 Tax=Neobacillus sp. YIM B06451 TaxID=3070994 RepID=UPI00293078C8|nr:suppressor of fused domain protein [Neobacillus sp. YIM B06451]
MWFKRKQKVSKSGSPIYKYDPVETKFEGIRDFDAEAKEMFEEHIEKHIGKINMVFHEIISNIVHVDVYHVAPTKERPFHTMITHGMSDLPMTVPAGAEDWRYAELVCFLPEEYDVSEEGFKDERNYWPIGNMKFLARFPHEYKTWLAYGHTLQNGNPIEPFIDGTKLCASLLIPPTIVDSEFFRLKVREDKLINIYNVFPIYLEEMQFKMDHGIDELTERFDHFGVNDLYDLNRVNTCR